MYANSINTNVFEINLLGTKGQL